MSGRSTRRRSKTTRALEAEEQAKAEKTTRNPRRSSSRKSTPAPKRKVQKPKHLTETPNGTTSERSSRGASPASSVQHSGPTRVSSRRRSSVQRLSAAYTPAKRAASGRTTPVSRASRSSSVTSNGTGRRTTSKKNKKKGRGYNPSLVNYKESEYHYGSDFEEEDVYNDQVESEDPEEESDDDESITIDSNDMEFESDVDLEEIVPTVALDQVPLPFWLQEGESIPKLTLPPSSEDLLIPRQYLLKVLSIYEILRRFHQILRLTPFRIEDFCAALSADEQSNLLSEIHIALLKTLIRSEETAGTSFGPIDLKDSINTSTFFIDSITWPDCLKAFLKSGESFNDILEVMESCEYPFAPVDVMVEKRVAILSFLTDQILLIPAIRDFIVEDGHQSNEEHCRVCHRLGEMLVCDTCPGVFHLGCLDPPLEEIPEDEWKCYVCQSNEVEGVSDCTAGNRSTCRQESLGFDRAGNKYWFMCRRLVVEMNDGNINYYSTVPQLEELSEVLDDEVYEKELWEEMERIRIDMERQMEMTELITNKLKSCSKKSYFEIENAKIEQIQKERAAQEEQKMEEVEEGDGSSKQTSYGEQQSSDNKDDKIDKAEEKSQNNSFQDGTKPPDSKADSAASIADTVITTSLIDAKEAKTITVSTESITPPVDKKDPITADIRMTRKTVQEITSGTLFFKLGQEGNYKAYINQYTALGFTLNKQQANEERIKKQHMSHKFSLTEIAAFGWKGGMFGNRSSLVNSLRQTVLQLEASLPHMFMHVNWPLLRKAWTGAVNACSKPRDFARAVTVLQCCMKPCMMLQVWNENLGHTYLKKITSQMKEDKKKYEKRERREKEEEEERLRPFMTHVKYTLGLKHQVSKQKGEEYRAHGQNGWLWLSSSRSYCPSDAGKLGLSMGPYRRAVKYSDIRDGTHKVVLMEPKAFAYLLSKQEEMDKKKSESSNRDESVDNTEKVSDDKKEDKITDGFGKTVIEKKRLEEALKNARLQEQEITPDMLEDVIDVCSALSNPTRVLYPKVARKAKSIDDFLSRRQQLKTLEERRIELKMGKVSNDESNKKEAKSPVPVEIESKTSITSNLAPTGPPSTSCSENRNQKANTFCVEKKKEIWSVINLLKSRLDLSLKPSPTPDTREDATVIVNNEALSMKEQVSNEASASDMSLVPSCDKSTSENILEPKSEPDDSSSNNVEQNISTAESSNICGEAGAKNKAMVNDIESSKNMSDVSGDVSNVSKIEENSSEATKAAHAEEETEIKDELEDADNIQSDEVGQKLPKDEVLDTSEPMSNDVKVKNEVKINIQNVEIKDEDSNSTGNEHNDEQEDAKKKIETMAADDMKFENKDESTVEKMDVDEDSPDHCLCLNKAKNLKTNIIEEGKAIGFTFSVSEATLDDYKTIEGALKDMHNILKLIMDKKKELYQCDEIGISTVTTTEATSVVATTQTVTMVNGTVNSSTTSSLSKQDTTKITLEKTEPVEKTSGYPGSSAKISETKDNEVVKQGDTNFSKTLENEKQGDDVVRVYSSMDSSGKLYLKRIQSVVESKKQGKVIKFPLAPNFFAKTRKKRNILLLAKHDVKQLSRKAGVGIAEGFNYNSKTNNLVWPYPCPRPYFKTAWQFRTATMNSLQAVALQVRILWASIKWDDMSSKPLMNEGRHEQMNVSSKMTTEILKHRHVGRYLERTEYFQRKEIIPRDVPKSVKEVAPIRSGLRKRKRAESPQNVEPQINEQWIPEDKLELFEIRAYKERIERERNASITRSRTGTTIKEPQRLDPTSFDQRRSLGSGRSDSAEVKLKVEEHLKQAYQTRHQESSPASNKQTATPMIIRKVTNPDGTISLIKTTTRPIAPSTPTGVPSNKPGLHPDTKKLFISKDGKIFGAQVSQSHGNVPIPANPSIASPNIISSSPQGHHQKVQIIRSSDGKIQVKGLLSGQQLVQMPDGKLQLFTSNPQASAPNASPQVLPQTTTLTNKIFIQSPASVAASPSRQASPMIVSPASTPTPGLPQTRISSPKPILAHHLSPGSTIPSGMTAFISGGKTFCIPKAATTMAKQHQLVKTVSSAGGPTPTTVAPGTPITEKPTITAITPTTQGKKMVEVKSLGKNSVVFKGHQMIVSGPDVAEAQNIAKLISTGQAQLANLGGKQVLISAPASASVMTLKSPQIVQNPTLPTQPVAINETQQAPAPPLQPDESSKKVEDPVQVTAQLLQTSLGPRIVLQGFQGSNLPKEDLAVIQTQVKHELLKAQAQARQQGKVPPTRIQIDLPPSIQAKLQVQSQKKHELQQSHLQVTITKSETNPPTIQQSNQVMMVSQAGGQHMTSIQQSQASSLSNVSPVKSVQESPKPISKPLPASVVGISAPKMDDSKPISDVLASLSPIAPPLQTQTIVNQSPNLTVALPTCPLPPNSILASPQQKPELETINDEKHPEIKAKLQTLLSNQKEMLKKDIAKKRQIQEDQLQVEICNKIDSLRQLPDNEVCPTEERQDSTAINEDEMTEENTSLANNCSLKRKRTDSSYVNETESNATNSKTEATDNASPPKKKKRHSSSNSSSSALASGLVKKDKIYCICKTKYDPSKFYVGCDVCNNWFHGSCVGITEAMSRKMTDYVCGECQNAKDNQGIYCICKQPYDESKFYIGCEKCSDWFHGHCVGILQREAETIDEYICPNCDPDSDMNRPNTKTLTEKDYEFIKKLMKQINANRNSWPFRQPVDSNEVPDYYNIVKEPMDLTTIETRVNQHHYKKLCEFSNDVTKIFENCRLLTLLPNSQIENCRLYNQPNSQIAKSAEQLETFFAQKLILIREKIGNS